MTSTPGTELFSAVLYFLTADATAIGINGAVSHVQAVNSGTAGT